MAKVNTSKNASATNKALADDIIGTVVTHGLCTGCGLCAGISTPSAVSMQISSAGYLRPVVNTAISEQTIAIFKDVCPGLKIAHEKQSANYHPIWGPLQQVRTGHAIDPEIHHRGSSGGVISALACYLLEQNIVKYVAQIAVSQSDPLRNELQLSRTRDEVIRAAGSRYAPSSPLSELGKLLAQGEKFAFIGKPCDVAALRRYAKHDPRVEQLVPYMFSFMCAGIPSIKGTYELLDKLGADRTQLKSFRYRGDGWPGMAKAEMNDGRIVETDYNSSWGTVLNRHLQFRCKICPDGTGEFADVVCADAWYGKDGYPDFTERDGRSLILSRSSQGEALIRSAIDYAIKVEPLHIDEIKLMQPYQVTRKQMVLARLFGSWVARKYAYPKYDNLQLIKNSISANPIEWLRSMTGTFRRAKGENCE